MVHNDVMDEAEARYGKTFEGVVGRVIVLTEEDRKRAEEEVQTVKLSRLGHWIAKHAGRPTTSGQQTSEIDLRILPMNSRDLLYGLESCILRRHYLTISTRLR